MEIKGHFTYQFDFDRPIRLKGKNGIVWSAIQMESGKKVILKWHKNKASSIEIPTHEGIQSLIEEIEFDQKKFRVYTYFEGIDLQSIFDEGHKKWKNAEFVVEKWIQLLEILKHLHSHHLLHTDIKLSNIIYHESEDRMYIIDIDSVQSFPLKNKIQRAYIFSSPEQYLGLEPLIGPWSDLFSLAICMYSILTRELPYPLEHAAMIEQNQLSINIRPHSRIPKPLFEIMYRCCVKPKFQLPPGRLKREELVKTILENLNARFLESDSLIIELQKIEFKKEKKWYKIW